MSNTDQTIQAPTTNTFGLMATPAVPCILAGQATKPRIKAEDKVEATRRRMLDQWNQVADLAKARGVHTPAVERFHDEMALLLAVTPDPAATLDRLLTVFARERAKNTPNACHVYPGLCVSVDGEDGDQVDEHGRHFDHGGRAITVPDSKCPGDPEIWAEFCHVSAGTPHIGFMGEALTTGQAREKAAQLRKFADEMDALADQVDVSLAALPTEA